MTSRDAVAHLRYQLHRHGWLAVVGLALIAGAIGLQLFGVAQARAHTAQLRAQAAVVRQRLAQVPDQNEAANSRLAAFYASLPGASGALDAIDLIHRSAGANGVKLAQGEYRLTREGSAQLLRYQITLPARSNYLPLRAWLADVMNALPTAALDEISFKRDNVGNAAVEAHVRLTLFLKVP